MLAKRETSHCRTSAPTRYFNAHSSWIMAWPALPAGARPGDKSAKPKHAEVITHEYSVRCAALAIENARPIRNVHPDCSAPQDIVIKFTHDMRQDATKAAQQRPCPQREGRKEGARTHGEETAASDQRCHGSRRRKTAQDAAGCRALAIFIWCTWLQPSSSPTPPPRSRHTSPRGSTCRAATDVRRCGT